MKLHNPWLLLLFIVYIPLIWWYVKKYRGAHPYIGVSSLKAFSHIPGGWKSKLPHVCFILQLAAIGCLIVALARPQSFNSRTTSSVQGTDIVLAVDISASMAANDLQPNRFEAAKKTAADFIQGRPDDNIGLVAFAGQSLSILPLTNDRLTLIGAVNNLKMGDLDNGTAIGDGLASAINRVISGKAKSKSIILLTDGTNNTGEVSPSTASDIARDKGVRIYTIGVGTDQTMAVTDPYGFTTTTVETKIDEDALREIAGNTHGKYFRARDEHALRDVFATIDTLEKSRLDVSKFTRMDENFFPWVLAALCCYVAMLTIRYTLIRRIP